VLVALALLASACSSTGPDEDPNLVDRVDVAPAQHVLYLGTGGLVQLNATVRNRAGTILTGRILAWQSSSPLVATVSGTGVVTAVGLGATIVRASVDGVEGTATITVEPPPVATVAVSLGAQVLVAGASTDASAVVRDAAGHELVGRLVSFTTSNPAVATVSPQGSVVGIAAGTATITATSETRSAVATICVVGAPPNLRIEQVLLSQAVQRPDGSVPLVAGGNPAEVRIFATSSPPLPPGCTAPRIRIIAFNGTAEAARLEANAGPLPVAAGSAIPSVLFVLERSLLVAGLRLLAEIDPGAVVPESNETDNTWPASGAPAQAQVVDVPGLELRMVPIFLTNGGSVGSVTASNMDEYLFATRQFYPISDIDWEIGETFSTNAAFGSGGSTPWIQMLSELDAKRVAEGSTRYYVGSVRPPPGVTSTEFGGFGYVPFNPAATGPGSRTSVLVGVGWFNRQRQTTELVAHELGHNHGRRHAPCGGAANPDPLYPHAGATIGVTGVDMYTWSLNGGTPPALGASTSFDVMSYCVPAWISDYNYEALLSARLAAGPPVAAIADAGAECECLLVWGTVEGDEITINPAFVVRTRSQPAAGGSFLVEGVREDGRVAFAQAFEPSEIDHAPGVRHFAMAIPLPESDREALALIRVRGPVGATFLDRGNARGLGRTLLRQAATGARMDALGQGRTSLSWSTGAFRAALVRNVATGAVLAIAREGELTLGASPREVEVILSDGVRSQAVRIRR
jgi:hypothetical protein